MTPRLASSGELARRRHARRGPSASRTRGTGAKANRQGPQDLRHRPTHERQPRPPPAPPASHRQCAPAGRFPGPATARIATAAASRSSGSPNWKEMSWPGPLRRDDAVDQDPGDDDDREHQQQVRRSAHRRRMTTSTAATSANASAKTKTRPEIRGQPRTASSAARASTSGADLATTAVSPAPSAPAATNATSIGRLFLGACAAGTSSAISHERSADGACAASSDDTWGDHRTGVTIQFARRQRCGRRVRIAESVRGVRGIRPGLRRRAGGRAHRRTAAH